MFATGRPNDVYHLTKSYSIKLSTQFPLNFQEEETFFHRTSKGLHKTQGAYSCSEQVGQFSTFTKGSVHYKEKQKTKKYYSQISLL